MNRLNRRARLLIAVAGMVAALSSVAGGADGPVILLTGFEPFGAGRPANPSWEGIKELDGQQWRGYVLAAREMKVEWGAPRTQLDAWIDELKPAAVFSFGMGMPEAFAIETRARNARGPVPDNEGKLPPSPTVAADGPEELAATIDAENLAATLADAGCRVRLSRDAGQYLCEETLYTLELLKSQGRVPGPVMFCHVPPLGGAVNGEKVTPSFVRQFVERLLAAWDATQSTASVLDRADAAVSRLAAADPREAAVREFIDRYFSTWSAQDMERYGQCFVPQAAVQLVDADGRLTTMPMRLFLQSQAEGHRKSEVGMTETPESVEVRFEGRLARVVVFWKLVEGERVEYGYDHFTLLETRGAWRIANLIFYATPKDEGP